MNTAIQNAANSVGDGSYSGPRTMSAMDAAAPDQGDEASMQNPLATDGSTPEGLSGLPSPSSAGGAPAGGGAGLGGGQNAPVDLGQELASIKSVLDELGRQLTSVMDPDQAAGLMVMSAGQKLEGAAAALEQGA